METKVVTLSKAMEGMRYLKHRCAGVLMNLRGTNRDISAIIHELAKENPEILDRKPHPKSGLTLGELLDMAERDSGKLTEIFKTEVK